MKRTLQTIIEEIQGEGSRVLSNYEAACNAVCLEFLYRYYVDESIDDVSWCWVGDKIGGVVDVHDDFHDMATMVEALRLKAPREKFHEWYNYSRDCYIKDQDLKYNLKTYLQLKKKP